MQTYSQVNPMLFSGAFSQESVFKTAASGCSNPSQYYLSSVICGAIHKLIKGENIGRITLKILDIKLSMSQKGKQMNSASRNALLVSKTGVT